MLVCSNSFSQSTDFDLSDYKLPNLNRKTLETQFNLSGNNSNDFYSNGSSDYITKNKSFSLSDDIDISFNHYLNNEQFQRNIYILGGFYSSYYKITDDTFSDSKRNYLRPSLICNLENRIYLNQNVFLETDLALSYYTTYYKRDYQDYEYEYNTINRTTSNDLSIKISIKTGWGRIEEVQDARHAIYILDELKKANRIKKEQSNEEIIEFARFISELKNKRFFDSRIQHMAEIEAVDSFLMTKGYVDKSDARYFATLNDFWTYGGLNVRESGSRISIGVIPGYYIYADNGETETDGDISDGDKVNTNAYSIDGGLEYNNEKPINLKWQNSLIAKAYLGLLNGNYKDTSNYEDYKFSSPNISLVFSDYLNFYPNTRTNLQVGYSLNYKHLINKADSADNVASSWGDLITSDLTFDFNYYISQKVRLNIYASLSYNWTNSPYRKYNYNNASYVNSIGSFCSTTAAKYDYDYKDGYLDTSFGIILTYSIF